ncbi:MAG: hypothetical protein ABEJ65_12620 [bacterium]
MSDESVMELIEEAHQNRKLRMKLSQDRSADELASSANREGYSISDREARKILAGVALTSDQLSDEQRQKLLAGLSWNFVEKAINTLGRDLSLLEEQETWSRTGDFYKNVFMDEEKS